jgi:acyl dehydratase
MNEAGKPVQAPLTDATIGAVWVSDWLTITQPMIDAFASAHFDSDPMHDDPVWAAENSPLGKTIAYGFQTISLLSYLVKEAIGNRADVTSSEEGSSLNYGFDRLRLVAPVPVGSRIRGRFTLKDRKVDERGRTVTIILSIVEIEDQDRPALVADWLSVWVPAER